MNGPITPVPREVSSRAMLIGEGIEEVLCFSALLKHLGLTAVQVEHYNGKSGLDLYLQTLKVRPGFAALKVLGITRDADSDPAAATASVLDTVRHLQFPAELKVDYFILPGKTKAGALEDLCLATLAGSPLERCVEDYLKCAARALSRSFEADAVRAKARIHAWLAVQDPPDLRLGHAAEKGLLQWESPVFEELKQFLRTLYG